MNESDCTPEHLFFLKSQTTGRYEAFGARDTQNLRHAKQIQQRPLQLNPKAQLQHEEALPIAQAKHGTTVAHEEAQPTIVAMQPARPKFEHGQFLSFRNDLCSMHRRRSRSRKRSTAQIQGTRDCKLLTVCRPKSRNYSATRQKCTIQ